MPRQPTPPSDPKHAAMTAQIRTITVVVDQLRGALNHIESADPKQRRRCIDKHQRLTDELEARVAEYLKTARGRR